MKPVFRYLDWMWYPAIMTGGFLLYFLLSSAGMPIHYSAYIPVFLAALAITTLEIYFPERKNWRPLRSEVVNDSTFMLIVQILLPQLLGYLAAYALAGPISKSIHIWPRETPVVLQVVLMILAADLMRYWLHRACHRYMPLWQLHAVHHSPGRLYWLNVGRFHPLEKALQFLFDALPFILLGVTQEVLSMYFIFYAINGFFQHSNVRARFGWLNYLISSAELHRWHHSAKKEESDRNFGNNIILWDLCFGTYFLPQNRQVGELGLINRSYPSSFIEQLKTPFIPRLEKKMLPLISLREILVNFLLKLRFARIFFTRWQTFIRATRNPAHVQSRLLRAILAENKNTAFGRKHSFSSIGNYQDFSRRVPLQSYDTLADHMSLHDPVKQGLTRQAPCFYQVTSGTTGAAKYLPVTRAGLSDGSIQQNLFALARYLDNPCTYTGKLFAIVSPAVEGHNSHGIPYGSASGLVYRDMPAMTRLKYVIPYQVFNIRDYETKYRLLALFAMAEPAVTLAASANPSTFIRIINTANENCEQLLHILETGVIDIPGIEEALLPTLNRRLQANASRAEQLRAIRAANGRLACRDIWPHLQSLVTWTGGSCGIPLSLLQAELPTFTKITDMGYLASEVRGTITIGEQEGVSTLNHNFFEFIERESWESGRHEFKLLHELEIGRQYYAIITTRNGLYRYFMNDIIQVTGKFYSTPTFRFLQKGKGVTNITGEKLYESQCLDAIRKLQENSSVSVMFHQWLADEHSAEYRVYIEAAPDFALSEAQLSATMDELIAQLNIEYAEKRKSGRLRPLKACLLKPGTGELFKKSCLQKGQREGQFKTITLTYLKDCDFPFQSHLLEPKA
jgi:sterol desaturase/sphingolipid hydroxylase (fatty acid hydroxylase superfamily)